MSKENVDIKATFKNIRTIYSETANLLLDADSLMSKSGYNCFHGNTLGTEQSKNINNPEWWVPPYASRYFTTAKDEKRIKAIGVFFLDSNYDPLDPIILFANIIRIEKTRIITECLEIYGFI